MALRIRRGEETDRTSITPEEGEFLYTTDEKKVYIGDGTTAGGNLVAGGGGTPGGSDTEVQFNDGGAFGGITGATTDGTILNVTTATGGTNTTQAASTQFVQQELNSGATVANVGAKLYLFNNY